MLFIDVSIHLLWVRLWDERELNKSDKNYTIEFDFWNMTLKQLEAFYWAASAVNFLVAAERLHVSQSALSKRISELEGDLGQTLFDRSGQRAFLTDAGQRLLPLARRMLGLADELVTTMAGDAGVRGHCRFGVGELAALSWLTDFVAYTRTNYQALNIEPCVDIGAALEQRVEAGELDFAVVAGYSTRSSIASETIGHVQFGWAAAPSLIGKHRTLNQDILRKTSLITMPHGAGPTRMLEQWLAVNNLEAGPRLVCNNLIAVASLIAGGLGIGLYPQAWLMQFAAKGLLVPLRHSAPLPAMPYTFQHRRDDSRPLLHAMRKAVEQTADFAKPVSFWASQK